MIPGVSGRDAMPPEGILCKVWGIYFNCHGWWVGNGKRYYCHRVETRDTAEHPIIQRPAPNKNYPAQDVNNAEARNPEL